MVQKIKCGTCGSELKTYLDDCPKCDAPPEKEKEEKK